MHSNQTPQEQEGCSSCHIDCALLWSSWYNLLIHHKLSPKWEISALLPVVKCGEIKLRTVLYYKLKLPLLYLSVSILHSFILPLHCISEAALVSYFSEYNFSCHDSPVEVILTGWNHLKPSWITWCLHRHKAENSL